MSLVTPVLLMGVPRPVGILILMVSLIITMSLGLWYLGIPLGLGCWALATWLTRLDPQWFEIGQVHLRLPKVFHTR
ncbi:VirB3 family type IV secretion system protein [Phycisphaera mikurensis]|uniref:VirB3 family type IV secretion system protein n=1 Tax=Phycisphaera mikurensis TaxID=547188 RepID=UPI0012B5DBB8|nr:VirB3 family type IV secretion system protein [Phycisphaera mikurensis]